MLGAIVVWIHITAAMFWVGGMLFFSLVLVPCLSSRRLPDAFRTELISRVGRRFRVFGWISLATLLATGSLRLFQKGVPLSGYGNALKIKLSLVFVMFLLTALHDFVLGPKSIRRSASDTGQSVLLQGLRWMARINLMIGLLIVLSAIFLVRGI